MSSEEEEDYPVNLQDVITKIKQNTDKQPRKMIMITDSDEVNKIYLR